MLLFYKKCLEIDTFTPLSEPSPGCWIHAEDAKNEDIDTICSLTGLEQSFLYDALDRYELPRLETVDNQLIIFVRHPVDQEGSLYTGTLTLLLTPDYFITISPFKSLLIQYILGKKILNPSDSTSGWLRDILLWVTQEFNLFIRKTRHLVLSKGKDFGAVTSEDIHALTKYEETLNQYQATLNAISLMLIMLFRMKSNNIYIQDEEVVEDIINHVKQSESLCEIIIKNIRSLRDAYQIIFANNLTKTIKLLTSLTIIITVPNIVASIYGMNVNLPLSEGPYAFTLIMGIMFALSGLCGYWFYRKNWM
jgi:magnesium transporter